VKQFFSILPLTNKTDMRIFLVLLHVLLNYTHNFTASAVLQKKSESDNCSQNITQSIDKLLTVLDSLSDVTSLFADVRRLERKVSKISKTLKKLGYLESENDSDEDDIDVDIRLVDSRTSSSSVTPPSTTPVTSSTTSELCPDGWTNIGEGCYQVVTNQATSWEEARDECLSQGADLAEMNNIQEHRAVNQFLNDWHYGIPFWAGGQRNKRGKWRWLWTETRIPTRAVKWGWAEGYPRELSGDNNCVAIRGRGQVGGLRTWEDAECSDNNHFICEYLWLKEIMSEEQQFNRISRELREKLQLMAT